MLTQCEDPAGYVLDSNDCNDADASIYTGAPELCDGVRNNCSAGLTAPSNEVDGDGDGYVECTPIDDWQGAAISGGGDCDDSDATLSPVALWYLDSDSDSFGDSATSKVQCTAPAGYVTDATDCDDGSAAVYPGAAELCDGIVNNCLVDGLNI